jgi:GntR family transcriptional regulator
MPLPRHTAYEQIAALLRDEILAGRYEPIDQEPNRNVLPGAAELGATYGVSGKTAGRAIQQLVTEGLVRARPGQRPLVVPRAQRPAHWRMTRRYARARGAAGLVFGTDMQGRDVTKRTIRTGRVPAAEQVAALLRIDQGEQVWARARETLIDSKVAELSVSYFPLELAEGTPLTTPGPFPSGGVVGVLEALGRRIVRTYNEVRARLASDEELAAFGIDPTRSPAGSRIVIEIAHATYGLEEEPLEAVTSVRPAAGNVIVFETYEGDAG